MEYLTKKQAAVKLSVSERTIARRIKDGVIPAVRLGKLIRIVDKDLDTALASKTENSCEK